MKNDFGSSNNQAAVMRYILAATATIAILAAAAIPARAQFGSQSAQKTPLELQYEREAKERAEDEKAYNTTMKRLKAQGPAATNSDPWKTVRPASEQKQR